MRCPTCNRNQKYRSGMFCEQCGYHFALNPKEAPFVADRRFTKGIELASGDRTHSYTPAHLHGVIFRRRNRAFWHRLWLARGTSDVQATSGALGVWRRAGHDVGPLIDRPGLQSSAEPPWPEPDLFDYGAESIIAVDDPLLVDLLVQNRVHTVCKVAIVDGHTGYPEPSVARLAPLVAARPDLPIFLLHDSSGGARAALESGVRERLGAADNPFVDLGLDVDVSKRIPAMRWSRQLPVVRADMLPFRWLTDGIAAAIANRVSLVDLLQPPPGEATTDNDSAWWILWDHADFDFG